MHKNEIFQKKFVFLGLAFIVFIFLFVRLYNLPNVVNFSDDQGHFLIKVYEMWETRRPTLLGPPTSFVYQGRSFFQGPAIYYFLLPPLLWGNWNPLFGSYFLIFLNLIGLLLLFYIGQKSFGKNGGLITIFLFATYPQITYYTKFIWNPSFLPFFSTLLLFLLLNLGRMSKNLRNLLIGVILGLALQFHFQIVLLIIGVFIYKLIKDRFSFLPLFLLGLVLGYLPMLFFELRHNFYNLKTIFLVFSHGSISHDYAFFSRYFMAFVPFLCFLAEAIAIKLIKKWRIFSFALITSFGIVLLWQSYQMMFENIGMSKDWTLPYEEKVAQIISEEHLKNFNVASLLGGNSRAYATRYLLEVKGSMPLDDTQYPNASYLFVITPFDALKTQNQNLWEISSFKGKVTKTWPIDPNGEFHLDLLTK